jgi:hypothetical protein
VTGYDIKMRQVGKCAKQGQIDHHLNSLRTHGKYSLYTKPNSDKALRHLCTEAVDIFVNNSASRHGKAIKSAFPLDCTKINQNYFSFNFNKLPSMH